jgi:hypothetical protein
MNVYNLTKKLLNDMYLATKQIQKGEGGTAGSAVAEKGAHARARRPSTPERTHVGKTTLGITPGGPTTKRTIHNLASR